jgi:hypothetical protein
MTKILVRTSRGCVLKCNLLEASHSAAVSHRNNFRLPQDGLLIRIRLNLRELDHGWNDPLAAVGISSADAVSGRAVETNLVVMHNEIALPACYPLSDGRLADQLRQAFERATLLARQIPILRRPSRPRQVDWLALANITPADLRGPERQPLQALDIPAWSIAPSATRESLGSTSLSPYKQTNPSILRDLQATGFGR